MSSCMQDGSRKRSYRKQCFSGRPFQIVLGMLLGVLATILCSCGDFWVDPKLTSVAINPAAASAEVGKTVQLTAVGGYDDGTSKKLTSVTWSSSDSSVASVSSSGLLQGVAPGNATITASELDTSGTTTVMITLSGVESIVVAPSSASIRGGETQAFNATAILNDGTSVDATDAVTWNSSDQNVAKIGSNGTAIGNSVSSTQTTTITASSGNTVSNKVMLSVSP